MGVRNSKEIGENLQKIVKRLLANQNLLKLLYYTNQDPLSQPDLTEQQITDEIFEKLIKIVPRVDPKENSKSIISIRVVGANKMSSNSEFTDVIISIEVFVPLTQWIIKDTNLRPFAILGELESSLDNKTINGLGRMTGGDFELAFLTSEMSDYQQEYRITAYD